jgi:hypothetical protein
MQKWIIAGLAGAAFVAGGFVAGTFAGPQPATAVTDATTTRLVDDTTSDGPMTGGPAVHRGPHDGGRHGLLGDVADELGVDLDAFRTSVADGATVAEALEAQGIDPADAATAMTSAGEARIDEALQAGRIDEDRAAELADDLTERVEAFLASTPPDRRFAERHPMAAVGIAQVADILDVDAGVVADGLRDGKSIAEIAEEHGVSRSDLVDQLVENATERIGTWVDATPGTDADR